MSWLNSPQTVILIMSSRACSLAGYYWLFLLQGFIFTFFSIPFITGFANRWHLKSIPNRRSSHRFPVPAFGGVALFGGLILSCVLLSLLGYGESKSVIWVIFLVFLVGLADDLFDLRADLKMVLFILLGIILALSPDLSLQNMHGFISLEFIDNPLSSILTVLLVVILINAFNLIDGVDGLAAMLGIFVLSVFSWAFYKTGNYNYLTLTLPLITGLLAFLFYNLWGKKCKIFLGDSGSLILGIVVSVSMIRFLNLNIDIVEEVLPVNPVTAISVVIVPVFDMIHVFIKRLLKGCSPFKAGKEHIHHTYLFMSLSHLKISIIILGYSCMFFFTGLVSGKIFNSESILIVLTGMAVVLWNTGEKYLWRNIRKFVIKRNIKRSEYNYNQQMFNEDTNFGEVQNVLPA